MILLRMHYLPRYTEVYAPPSFIHCLIWAIIFFFLFGFIWNATSEKETKTNDNEK